MKANHKIILLQILLALIILIVWQLFGDNNSDFLFVLGSPSKIGKEFWDLLVNHNLLGHFFITGAEAVSGLIIGTIVGNFAGLILWYSKNATAVIRPFVVAIGTLPIFAFAPLFIFWFGIGFMMKAAIAAFSTVFVAFSQSNRGATNISSQYIEALLGMNASKHKIFKKVVVPASINWVFNSMRINVGFALLGAFIGEFISADKGLGHLILKAAGVYNISRAFAAAIGITVLALILDFLARLVEKYSREIVQFLSVPKVLLHKT